MTEEPEKAKKYAQLLYSQASADGGPAAGQPHRVHRSGVQPDAVISRESDTPAAHFLRRRGVLLSCIPVGTARWAVPPQRVCGKGSEARFSCRGRCPHRPACRNAGVDEIRPQQRAPPALRATPPNARRALGRLWMVPPEASTSFVGLPVSRPGHGRLLVFCRAGARRSDPLPADAAGHIGEFDAFFLQGIPQAVRLGEVLRLFGVLPGLEHGFHFGVGSPDSERMVKAPALGAAASSRRFLSALERRSRPRT